MAENSSCWSTHADCRLGLRQPLTTPLSCRITLETASETKTGFDFGRKTITSIFCLKRILAISLIAVPLFLSGCRLVYLFHAAAGQFQLLSESIPVQEALDEDLLPPDQRARLLLVAKIKEFGENNLGLRKTDSYETVFLKSGQDPIYTVSASPKDRLQQKTWDFPIVGEMPYLGFFDLEKAKEKGKQLSDENLDVFIGAAGAYSTLGWFADPVTKNLLEGSTPQLVEIILHEMTHATLYVKSQGAFNEGLAVLVGKVGALRFFTRNFGPSHPFTIQAKASIEDERIFSTFVVSLLKELDTLYHSPCPYEEKMRQRERVFRRSLEKFAALKTHFQTDAFSEFGRVPLNNAYILAVGLYHSHFELFEAALAKEKGSIKELMQYLKASSENEGDLLERTREWIEKSRSNKDL